MVEHNTPSLVVIGVLLVAVAAFFRFKVAPIAPKRSQIAGVPQWLGCTLTWLTWKGEPQSALFPPPRANTTFMKYLLFRLSYVCIFVMVYLAIGFITGVAKEVDTIFEIIRHFVEVKDFGRFQDFGPIALAVVIMMGSQFPPFRWIDLGLRGFLYEHAAIDGQRIFESNRLKRSDYRGEDLMVAGSRKAGAAHKEVCDRLVPDGFDREDLRYLPGAPETAHSLWMKASLLNVHISNWEAMNKYKTAFKVLTERDSNERSVKAVHNNYEILKGNAVTCFKALREAPDLATTRDREADLRRDCKALLDQMYNLLARVSLISHYSDYERIECMGEIGFRLDPIPGGPTPDADEMVCLAAIVAVMIVLPLWWLTDHLPRTLAVGFAMSSAMLTPVVLAHLYPRFAFKKRTTGSPSVAFPCVSGLVSGAIGFVVIFLCFSGASIERMMTDLGDTQYYQWTTFLFLLAALIGHRMRVGEYPGPSELESLPRHRAHGDLRDASIFAGSIAVLVFALFAESTLEAWGEDRFALKASRLVLPPPFAFVVGFLIPTWYRAQRARPAGMTRSRRRPWLGDPGGPRPLSYAG